MPDTPAPLSPEGKRVSKLEQWSKDALIGKIMFLEDTVRYRERERDVLMLGSQQDMANFNKLRDERDELKRQLDDDSPGTPLGRLNAMGQWAEEHCGHHPLSAYGFEVTIIEYVERIERELDTARKASLDAERRLKAVPESLLCDQRDPCSYDHTCRIHKALAELRRIAGGENG